MKNIFFVSLLTALVLLWSCDLCAQVSWMKYAGNPVVGGGPQGSWYRGVFGACVLYNSDSSRFEMWFTGSPTAGGERPCQIGYAVSADGLNWDVRATPVLTPTQGMWDGYTVEMPCVVREQGGYKMWYGGGLSFPMLALELGYATSADGIDWSKHGGNPVLGPGTSPWEAGGVGNCSVLPTGGGYKMWYWGATTGGINDKVRIGYATSPDGISWQRDTVHNPILEPGPSGSWDSYWITPSEVLFLDGKYYMWYTGTIGVNANFRVGLATSLDGITNWVKDQGNPVLGPSPSGWDAAYVESPSVIQRGDSLLMWYDGSPSPMDWKIGHAFTLITSAVDEAPLPVTFALKQNYPNPFNPTTTIRYELPRSLEVRLTVYDLLGREVAVLVNEGRDAGVHEVKLNGSSLSSGVYLYRLQAGDRVQVRKAVLMR